MTDETPTHLQVDVPPEMKGGVYSDGAMVWHSQNGFTIDFLAPISPGTEVDGAVQQPVTVVARVRLPVGVIFQVARAISENVARYEAKFGHLGAGGPDHTTEEGS